MSATLFPDNDNLLEVDGLKNAATGAYLNSATVTVTLVDEDGNNVTGVVDLAMDYVADSSGKYRATLKDTLSLTAEERYAAQISANAGDDLQGYWEFELRTRVRDN